MKVLKLHYSVWVKSSNRHYLSEQVLMTAFQLEHTGEQNWDALLKIKYIATIGLDLTAYSVTIYIYIWDTLMMLLPKFAWLFLY